MVAHFVLGVAIEFWNSLRERRVMIALGGSTGAGHGLDFSILRKGQLLRPAQCQ